MSNFPDTAADDPNCEADRSRSAGYLLDQLKKFWAAHPLPPHTGLSADKEFFDDLSGDV
jgi:hypothetical protein